MASPLQGEERSSSDVNSIKPHMTWHVNALPLQGEERSSSDMNGIKPHMTWHVNASPLQEEGTKSSNPRYSTLPEASDVPRR